MKLRHNFTVLLLLLPRAHTNEHPSAEVSVLCLETDEKVTFPNTLRTRRSTSRYLVSPRHTPCNRFLVRTNCQGKLCGWNLLPSKNFTITYFLDFLPRVALLAENFHTEFYLRKNSTKPNEYFNDKGRFSVHIWLQVFLLPAC